MNRLSLSSLIPALQFQLEGLSERYRFILVLINSPLLSYTEINQINTILVNIQANGRCTEHRFGVPHPTAPASTTTATPSPTTSPGTTQWTMPCGCTRTGAWHLPASPSTGSLRLSGMLMPTTGRIPGRHDRLVDKLCIVFAFLGNEMTDCLQQFVYAVVGTRGSQTEVVYWCIVRNRCGVFFQRLVMTAKISFSFEVVRYVCA